MVRTAIITIIFLLTCYKGMAQGPYSDPGRVAAWLSYDDNIKSKIKKQKEAQMILTAEHMLLQSEVEQLTKLKRELNGYLDDLHDVLMVAASIYGIYYEIRTTAKNIKELNDIIKESPTNVMAVAFSERKRHFYNDIITTALSMTKDIKTLCFNKDGKMSESDKIRVLAGIRPKLTMLNKQIKGISLVIKYTSLESLWNEMTGYSAHYTRRSHKEIAMQCQKNWMVNAKATR